MKNAKKTSIPDRDVLGGCSQIGGAPKIFPALPGERIPFRY